MLDLFFGLFGPHPKFHPGWLVVIPKEDMVHTQDLYLLIQRRRWIRPQGETKRMWVYDGIAFKIEGRRLVYATMTYCVYEASLQQICGLEYPDIGYVAV